MVENDAGARAGSAAVSLEAAYCLVKLLGVSAANSKQVVVLAGRVKRLNYLWSVPQGALETSAIRARGQVHVDESLERKPELGRIKTGRVAAYNALLEATKPVCGCTRSELRPPGDRLQGRPALFDDDAEDQAVDPINNRSFHDTIVSSSVDSGANSAGQKLFWGCEGEREMQR